jgi:hypothetical protein
VAISYHPVVVPLSGFHIREVSICNTDMNQSIAKALISVIDKWVTLVSDLRPSSVIYLSLYDSKPASVRMNTCCTDIVKKIAHQRYIQARHLDCTSALLALKRSLQHRSLLSKIAPISFVSFTLTCLRFIATQNLPTLTFQASLTPIFLHCTSFYNLAQAVLPSRSPKSCFTTPSS